MNKELVGGVGGTILSAVGTATQPNAQLEKFSIILTIIATCFTILMAILALIKWFKDAKKDGKIDEEEKEQGKNIFMKIVDGFKTLFSIFKKKDKDKEE